MFPDENRIKESEFRNSLCVPSLPPERDAIRQAMQRPGIPQGVATTYRWEQLRAGVTPSLENAGSSAAAVNRAAAIAKWGGRGGVVLGAAGVGLEVAVSDNKSRALAQGSAAIVGGGGGASAGAVVGAAVGSVFPGPGTLIGGIIGAVAGGVGGGSGGHWLGGAAYDSVNGF